VQQPFEFGYRSMELMSKYLNGDKSQVPPSKQIFVPTKAIKKDNVEAFTKEINTLRGRS
jgi:ribose transport system substrate-binding protein